MLGIRWKDIDFEGSKVKLVQQLVKIGSKNVIRELKIGSSQNRVIALPDLVVAALQQHKNQKRADYKSLGFNDFEVKEQLTELVFTNSMGNSLQPRNFIRSFKSALKAAGLLDRHFIHCGISSLWSLQSGVDVKTLQSDLGHDEVKTTLDRYGDHVNTEMKQEAARKRSHLFSQI